MNKQIYTSILLFICLFSGQTIKSQDSINNLNPKVDFSGYIETYYSYDFNKPETGIRQPFLYTYNRHNEFNINLALIKVSVSNTKYRANLAIQSGTYVSDNYAAEDEELRMINEANVGISLNSKNNLWLDAGILPSHIGFESAIGPNNQNLTRSLLAENSPYFLTGVKLTYDPSSKWLMSVSVFNGWQRIKRLEGNSLLSLGTQLTYKKSDRLLFNWSTFIGKEAYGADFGMRYFSNLYWDNAWSDKWRTILGFDFGAQDISPIKEEYKTWLTPTLITQYSISNKWQMAYRIEYFQDKNNIMATTAMPFETLGNSLNFDFLPNSKMKIRTEGKWFHATESIFDLETKKDNFSVTTTMSFEF